MPDESPTLDLLERLAAASDRMTFDALLRQVGLPEKVLRGRLKQLVDRGWVDAYPADGYTGETYTVDAPDADAPDADPLGAGPLGAGLAAADAPAGSAGSPGTHAPGTDPAGAHVTGARVADGPARRDVGRAVVPGGRPARARGGVDRARGMTFAIGVGALRPGSAFLSGDRAARLAGPILTRARDLVDESFRLVRLDGTAIVCLAGRESSRDMAGTPVGRRLPAYAAASGRAILAYRSPAEVEALLDQGLEAHTVDSVVDRAAFFAELAEARERGWAYERGQMIPGIGCIAAALLPAPGGPGPVDGESDLSGGRTGERGAHRAGDQGRGRHARATGDRSSGFVVTDSISCAVPLARLTDDHAEDIAAAVLRACHELAVALRG
ncbi:IclR family transcriptional regulator [Dactylosporangium sucinum]|uniref:IclR-ED domain-containing protein n=1 Tax=Dactylosporangium sucinum TaxID=1424081 RepID=A0A917WS28_9ACTN|nr:IclR family transcriptional regulator C-terminal domain-containing protein [Dactylosporangium sucinum]GGM24781.1 hypothetical protein GCM10007977_027360 [Dactylosporangium sucinum]